MTVEEATGAIQLEIRHTLYPPVYLPTCSTYQHHARDESNRTITSGKEGQDEKEGQGRRGEAKKRNKSPKKMTLGSKEFIYHIYIEGPSKRTKQAGKANLVLILLILPFIQPLPSFLSLSLQAVPEGGRGERIVIFLQTRQFLFVSLRVLCGYLVLYRCISIDYIRAGKGRVIGWL